MNIAIICGNLDPKIGGGSSFCRCLLNCLHDELFKWSRFKIILFVKNKEVPAEITNFPIILYKEKNLVKILKKQKIDITWFMSGGGFPPAVETPYFATIWDLQHRENPYLPEMQFKGEWLYREKMTAPFVLQAALLFVGTKKGQEELIRNYGVPSNRVCVLSLPCPIQVPNQEKKQTFQRCKNSFLYPAQFWAHKNHSTLIYALAILNKKKIPIKLVLPGDDKGNLVFVKKLCTKLNVEQMVEFPGFLSDEKVREYYKSSTALLFPSSVGPDNLPPLEALAYGCPVVQADLQGPREQLGDTAFYAPVFSPETWAEYMEDFACGKMNEKCEIKRKQGLELVLSRQPQAYLNKVFTKISLFNQVIGMWKITND